MKRNTVICVFALQAIFTDVHNTVERVNLTEGDGHVTFDDLSLMSDMVGELRGDDYSTRFGIGGTLHRCFHAQSPPFVAVTPYGSMKDQPHPPSWSYSTSGPRSNL